MATVEEKLSQLQQINSDLVSAVSLQTQEVSEKITHINDRLSGKEQEVDQFIQEATPEKRFVQYITVEGSPDYLYPVFWRFPANDFGVGKLEISRHYTWNQGIVGTDDGLAALLLQLEGNAHPWSGDANYLRVVKYHKRYAKTASHLQFAGYAHRNSTDGNPPSYGADGINYLYSGIYLRGGGLSYVLSSNWTFAPIRLPDENDLNSQRVLHTHQNTQFVVRPIPFSELIEPVED